MGLETVFGVYEQHMRRPACASVQSVIRLLESIISKLATIKFSS